MGGLGAPNEQAAIQTKLGSALDQVPLPVDVSAGLTFTGRDLAPRK